MKTSDWLAKARENADALRSLILRWHPSRRVERSARTAIEPQHPITAKNPERACRGIREEIKARDFASRDQREPVERFDAALREGDFGTVYALLSDAWFGVPESTSCWSITGFAECVDLMDDPPEADEEER